MGGKRSQQQTPLKTDRGSTIVQEPVVAQVAGIAAQEVEGVWMGGGAARAVGGFLEGVTSGSSSTRGVMVEVGEEEAAVDLDMAVEYGKSIIQVFEAVRCNVINRIENLVGLRVTEVNLSINDVLFQQQGLEGEAGEQEESS